MRKFIQFLGIFMFLSGISGAIDHLVGRQPLMGIFLNQFNRTILPRLEFLAGYELFANLTLAVLGAVVVIAAERIPRS